LLFAALPALLAAASMDVPPSHTPTTDVTIILDVKGAFALAAMREMESEAGRIIGTSGIRLDWRMRNDATATFNDLVVLTFKGSCLYEAVPQLYDELGPYAFTRTSNGEVQPFGEVDCDHVVGSVRNAMFGNDFAHSDMLVGRALGRVVAHELVHMLTKSGEHGHEGVQKPALSGKQLISASLPLSALDVDRLRQHYPVAPPARTVSQEAGRPAESETR
jgi:hypothetical protein